MGEVPAGRLTWGAIFLVACGISTAVLAYTRFATPALRPPNGLQPEHASEAIRGSDEASPRRLMKEDPCWIHHGCYKGVYWHPGWDQMGSGWYCDDGVKVGKWSKFDNCSIKSPCYFGIFWAHHKQWECAMENATKTLENIEELLLKMKKGPHDGDRIWAIKELDSELPAPQTQCSSRGWQAPKKCRMLGLEHGKMILGAKGSSVIFDLLTHKDDQLRWRAAGILDGMVIDDKENLNRMTKRFGGLVGTLAAMNPADGERKETREQAAVIVNLIANQCQAMSADMCSFFPQIAKMDSEGLGELVLDPPKGIGTKLQVSLQEAWVSSCTTKFDFPSHADFKACGGNFLKKIPHLSSDKAYAVLQSLHELLWKDIAKQMFRDALHDAINPWLDDDNVPSDVKSLGKDLLSPSL